MSADDSEDERRDPTEEPEYSDEPDQTHPKTRNGDDDRDDDAEDRAADDADATEARSEVADMSQQVGLEESVEDTEGDGQTGGGDTDDQTVELEAKYGDSDEDDDSEPESDDGEDGGGVDPFSGDWNEGEPEGFDGTEQENAPEGTPVSEPAELNTDPEAVEEEFGIDLSNTDDATQDTYGIQTLARSESEALADALKEKHGDEPVDTLEQLTKDWKVTSYGESATRLEAIARDALDVDAGLRVPDGETEYSYDFPEPTEGEVAAFQDYTRVSRAFLKEHYGDGNGQMALQRGIPHSRKRATADLTRQMFEDPDRDTYLLRTSVLSNHSVQDNIAGTFEDNYSISYKSDISNVAFMPTTITASTEGEVHISGGGIRLPPSAVGSVVADRSFADLTTEIESTGGVDHAAKQTLSSGMRAMQHGDSFDEDTAKRIIRYSHSVDDIGTESAANELFTKPESAGFEHRDLYRSYNPETDTFGE